MLSVALVLVGVGTLLAGVAVGPEHAWPFALAEYVPYPAYLLPCVAACVVSLVLLSGASQAQVAPPRASDVGARTVMESAATLSVPLVVETGVGDNWASAH